MSQNTSRIETLNVAVTAIAECLKAGRVSNESLAPIAGAIALGIAPPFVRPGCRPFFVEGVKAQPGTWPHFAKALCNIESQQLDLSKLREKAKAGDQSAERRGFFVNMVLTSVHGAFVSALRRAEELEEAEMRRQKAAEEARQRQESEEQRKAREARQAARRALEAAALGNSEAPVERKPQQRSDRRRDRLTPDSVKRLLASVTRQREEDGHVGSEAKLSAARFVFSKPILTAAKDASYTENEISLLKSEVKCFVQNVYFSQSGKLAEAEREAANWLARAEGFARRQDNAPKQGAPAAANPPVPSQEKRPDAKPAAAETGSETTMGLALAKAGIGGKAANG